MATMKCPKGDGELRHSSPSMKLGIKDKYTSLVYVCDTCHGVWVENPQLASIRQQTLGHKGDGAQRVECPSCHSMVAELVEAGPGLPGGVRMCSHCLAILKYETMHVGTRTI